MVTEILSLKKSVIHFLYSSLDTSLAQYGFIEFGSRRVLEQIFGHLRVKRSYL
jgi:hypothetical protein